jgi:hypothetical protein
MASFLHHLGPWALAALVISSPLDDLALALLIPLVVKFFRREVRHDKSIHPQRRTV